MTDHGIDESADERIDEDEAVDGAPAPGATARWRVKYGDRRVSAACAARRAEWTCGRR
ncbi:hypothetical protein [Streptomyces sp. NPDC058385]|uniref:hypothetical protein n=1 Tax=Streptomyces sp. NPDC058385 TaxID=3346473 RepID=UPI00364DB911